MSSCSPRQILRASISGVRPAGRPEPAPRLSVTSRTCANDGRARKTGQSAPFSSSVACPHASRSRLKPSRRNAHALASHAHSNERAPPPPPPPPPSPVSKAAPRDSTAEERNKAFPVWETRSPPPSLQRTTHDDIGDTVYADEEDGDVDLEWDAHPRNPRTSIESSAQPDSVPAGTKMQTQQTAPSRPPPSAPGTAPCANPIETSRTGVPLFAARVRRRPRGQLRLESVDLIPPNSIAPYIVPAPPAVSCPVHPSPQPHEVPLVSRSDWRLSSPLRRYLRSDPPSLYSRMENDTKAQGHNRLVGIGVEPGRTARGPNSREVEGSEPWGWKIKVKESERGSWPAADTYRKRLDRLVTLSRKADEESYRSNLARQGTPTQRELDGKTLCRAVGTWLTDSTRAEEIQDMKMEGRSANTVDAGGAGSGPKAIASFSAEDERLLTEDLWDFSAANTIVRITRARPEQSSNSTGPQPPPSASADPSDWFVQGTVLEARGTQLVVAFEESDMWPLGEEDLYQIDVGLDESSYILQEQAIKNLYFDPARQRRRNAKHVEDAQEAYNDGSRSIIREWSLQGSDLRELIVPRGEEPDQGPARRSWRDSDEEEDLLDDVLAEAEAGVRAPVRPTLPDHSTNFSASSATTALHPSDLLTQNQLINSWVQRYMRDDPMSLPGDPDLGLNPSQTKAVAMAIGEKLSLIQGPPGTGKSQTIVSLISLLKLHFRIPQPILLAAPTHVSTDHLLSLLVRRGLNPLRCGKPSKVSPEIEKWTIEKRQEQHPLWNRLEATRLESESVRDELKKSKEATASILHPQERAIAEARDVELEQRYRKLWRRYIMLEQKLYSSLLATADVFCATALGSGASKVLNLIDFPIVFVDEAAMCTEPVSLIPIMKGAQQVTLIGDHKQLPAVVSSQEAKKERLQISLFERLLTSQNVNSVLLDTQYRMRPAISAFPNLSFYHSELQDALSVRSRPPPPRSRFFALSESPTATDARAAPVPVAFVSHPGAETTSRQSILNRTEVDLIVEIVGDLLDRNPALDPRDIGIISPYWAQTRLLVNTFESGWASKRLAKVLGRSRASEVQSVEINTVDGFQGREKKVIILSTVRSNKSGRIGFLTDKRRLNVALTRAKDALFVVGNKNTLKQAAGNDWMDMDPDADAGIWKRFLTWCEHRGLVKDWKQSSDMSGV